MAVLFSNTKLTRERGDNGLFITIVPKDFLIRWLNRLTGDFSEFWLVGSFSWVFKRFNHLFISTKRVILCIINGDVLFIFRFRFLQITTYFSPLNSYKHKLWRFSIKFYKRYFAFVRKTRIIVFKNRHPRKAYIRIWGRINLYCPILLK